MIVLWHFGITEIFKNVTCATKSLKERVAWCSLLMSRAKNCLMVRQTPLTRYDPWPALPSLISPGPRPLDSTRRRRFSQHGVTCASAVPKVNWKSQLAAQAKPILLPVNVYDVIKQLAAHALDGKAKLLLVELCCCRDEQLLKVEMFSCCNKYHDGFQWRLHFPVFIIDKPCKPLAQSRTPKVHFVKYIYSK